MPRQLPFECQREIFVHLDDDTLRSCLLVNRFWFEVSVPILWTSIQNHRTLIACLPDESKEFLLKNRILLSPFASKPPSINYVAFVKTISDEIGYGIQNSRSITPLGYAQMMVVMEEIFKMLMNQTTLKSLSIDCYDLDFTQKLLFITYPGATDCLRNLSELTCDSNIPSDLFRQLSQTCRKLRSLRIKVKDDVSSGLTDLIHAQRNLKRLGIFDRSWLKNSKDVTTLTNLPNTLNQFYLGCPVPLSFITRLANLKEIVLELFDDDFDDFERLQHVTFSRLRTLKFMGGCPQDEHVIQFLKNNGRNLEEIRLQDANDSLNLALAKFCPNLKSLYTRFGDNELESLKVILNSCQHLESVEICYGSYDDNYLNKLTEIIAPGRILISRAGTNPLIIINKGLKEKFKKLGVVKND